MAQPISETLHSAAPVVAIEAAAGCGKTTSAAQFAQEAAGRLESGKVLLLSHTHAACGEFQRKCGERSSQIDVETCDGFFLKTVGLYARPLGLPIPVDAYLESGGAGLTFTDLSRKAGELFQRAPTVARAVANHYPLIVLDEHQDASVSQHEAIWLLREIGGSMLRVFGDPMQAIHTGESDEYVDWVRLWNMADEKLQMETPHRWSDALELGEWIVECRAMLKRGNPIPVRDAPAMVSISTHAGLAGRERFRDSNTAAKIIHGFLNDSPNGAAMLAFLTPMAKTIAQTGSWRAPMNEGAQLEGLDQLIDDVEAYAGDPAGLARAVLDFLQVIGVGLSSAVRSRVLDRVGLSINHKGAGTNQLAWLACLEPIYARPDHRGVGAAVQAVRRTPPPGFTIRFRDHAGAACSLARTDDPRRFRSSLGRIRRHTRWPRQMVSTIHKAKGLEFDNVLLCPVDHHQYPNKELGARLLYVALSRARLSIRLAVSRDTQPLHVSLF